MSALGIWIYYRLESLEGHRCMSCNYFFIMYIVDSCFVLVKVQNNQDASCWHFQSYSY